METADSLSYEDLPATSRRAPERLSESSERRREDLEEEQATDHEYAVVELRFAPITIAYASFFVGLAWLRLFFWLWDGPWLFALSVALLIGGFGTSCGWRAYRRQRSFAALCALLLSAGFLASLLLPTFGFFVVMSWPR